MSMQLASKTRRFVTFIVDLFFWLFVSIVIFLIMLFSELFGGERYFSAGDLWNIALFLSFWAYFYGMEVLFKRTMGKLISGTKVINIHGGKPSAKSILIRTLIRMITLEYLSFLHAKVGHHDLLSDTRVITTRHVKKNVIKPRPT